MSPIGRYFSETIYMSVSRKVLLVDIFDEAEMTKSHFEIL